MLSSTTITFLFTDIEGSTPAWEQHPGDIRSALEQHNTILKQVSANHNGLIFKIVGDEFQVAFTDPIQAVEAAIDIQRQLISAQWPAATGPLQVRMGIQIRVMLDRRQFREGRYRFLEPIRQYAREKLEGSSQVNNLSRRHQNYYLAYAEKKAQGLTGDDQVVALNHLESEADNFRKALACILSAPATPEECISLVVALGEFWLLRGNLHVGRQWISEVLSHEETCACPDERTKALHIVAMMAYRQSDYTTSKSAWEECLQISQQLGKAGKRGVHLPLTGLGNVATEVGDYETAPQFTEASEITRQMEDKLSQADVLRNLGWAAMRPGDYRLASSYLEEALALFRKLNHKVGLASTLSGLGEMALWQGDFNRSQFLVEESLELRSESDDKWGIGASLGTLGWVALLDQNYDSAQQIFGENLTVCQELGDKGGIAWCLEKLALIAQYRGRKQRAARLYGAASIIRLSINSVIDPADQPEYEQHIMALKGDLGEESNQVYWDEGQGMSQDEAVAVGLIKQ